VNGELRIGFFSKRPIAANEELTFDYQFQKVGKVQQKCYCGSEKCRGYLGVSTSNNNNQQQQSSPGGAFDHLWDETESSDDNDESSDSETEKSDKKGDLKQKRKSSNKEDFEVKRNPLNPI